MNDIRNMTFYEFITYKGLSNRVKVRGNNPDVHPHPLPPPSKGEGIDSFSHGSRVTNPS